MKLMKSFLTLLLLGGMTFAGCDKAKSGDEPAGETPSGETPSGETPSGETPSGGGDSTPSGGGGSGTEDKFTVSFDANGGTGTMTSVSDVSGEYTLPECTLTAPEGKEFDGWKVGTAGEVKAVGEKITVTANVTLIAQWKDIPAPANHFDNKKIVVDDFTITPVSSEDYSKAYISLFGESKEVEFVVPFTFEAHDYYDVLFGTYEENSEGTAVTITITKSFSQDRYFKIPTPMQYELSYDSSKESAYEVDITIGTKLVHCEGSASEDAPAHIGEELPNNYYIFRSTDGAEWGKTDLLFEAIQEDPYLQLVGVTTFAENEVFAIKDGSDWRHCVEGDFPNNPNTHGGKIVDDGSSDHNFKVTEAGEYRIYVKSGKVYIVHDTEVTYKFWLKNSGVMTDTPDFYIWYWNEAEGKLDPKGGHWKVCEVSYYNEVEPYIEVTFPNYIVGGRFLRCNPGAESKPVDGSDQYGEPTVWNQVEQNFNRTGGDVDIYFW